MTSLADRGFFGRAMLASLTALHAYRRTCVRGGITILEPAGPRVALHTLVR